MKTAAPTPVHFRSEQTRHSSSSAVRWRNRSAALRQLTIPAKVILNNLWGLPPLLDLAREKRTHDAMREVAAAGLAESAHDLSDGGLRGGPERNVYNRTRRQSNASGHKSAALNSRAFSEKLHRDILVASHKAAKIRKIAARHGVECLEIGATMKGRLQIGNAVETGIDLATSDLKNTFENSLPRLLQTESVHA